MSTGALAGATGRNPHVAPLPAVPAAHQVPGQRQPIKRLVKLPLSLNQCFPPFPLSLTCLAHWTHLVLESI